MDKNPRDTINKAAYLMIETAKDAAQANVLQAVRATPPQIEIKPEQLPTLLAIIVSSVEEGYHRANRSFCRTVDEALASSKK